MLSEHGCQDAHPRVLRGRGPAAHRAGCSALMSAVALNRLFRGRRRHLAVMAVIACLGATVAVHHLSPDDMGMAGMAAHSTMVVCLGVIPLVALAIATGLPLRLPRLLVGRLRIPRHSVVMAPAPRARSSPVATVVLRL